MTLALTYGQTADYAKAEPLYQQALKIREKALGLEHPDTAACLSALATLYHAMGDYAKEEPLCQRVLMIVEKVLGPEHLATASALNNLARTYSSMADYAKAEPLYQRALKIQEKVHGLEHPNTAKALNNLAIMHRSKGDYAKAEPLQQRALKIQEKVQGPDHLETAVFLNNLATLYHAMRDYAKAVPLQQQTLRILENVHGPEHPQTANALNNLAVTYDNIGVYAKAEPLYQRAVKIREKELGPEHPATARSLCDLARTYFSMADYANAEPLYQRALKIQEKVLGPEHPGIVSSLIGLANTCRSMADYAKAEPLYQRALKIREKAVGPEHPDTAKSLHNLAVLYASMADYAKAEPLYQRAVKILEKALGSEHPDTAKSLLSLGALYVSMADYAKAEPFQQRALKIQERTLGTNHPDTANSLLNLGALYISMADYAKAEPLQQRALKIQENVLGPEHPLTVSSLGNLATLYYSKADYAKAEPLYQRALNSRENMLGPDHPDTGRSALDLGALHDALGNSAKAEPLIRRGLDIALHHGERTSSVQSERQQFAMAIPHQRVFGAWLSVAQRALCSSAEMAEVEFQVKGRIAARQQDARQLREGIQASSDPAVRALFEKLDLTTRMLAALAHGRAGEGLQGEPRLKQLAALTEEKEGLERQLAKQSASFREYQQRASVTLAGIRSSLARCSDTVLVDFLEYRHLNPPQPGQGANFEQRLLAFVLRSDTNEIAMVELGLAAPINGAVAEWRKAMAKATDDWKQGRPIGNEVEAPGLVLRESVWSKLEPKLGGAKRVILSLDGGLCQIPFAALPGSKPGSYLIEEFSFTSLPIPRLLPDLMAASALATNQNPTLLAVGDVDYGADPGVVMLASRAAVRGKDIGSTIRWTDLPATKHEVRAHSLLFEKRFAGGQVRKLQRELATEQNVRDLAPQFRYLHFATHGYFGDASFRIDFKLDSTRIEVGSELYGRQDVIGWNPGLLSGLVLAGANSPPQEGKDDGYLTALEVQALDLRKVELAVLSACETGLGKPVNSEGLLGLQRAFQLAGARTVVASMWQVPSDWTMKLMARFYENLWDKRMEKLEALREAQLSVMRDAAKSSPRSPVTGERLPGHPFFWAAFVLSGDWR